MQVLKRCLLVTALLCPLSLQAADPQQCDTIRVSDVGWTDVTMTTAMVRLLLAEVGYSTQVQRLSLPDTYLALAGGGLDVFFGNWMPAQSGLIDPYLRKGEIETLQVNLEPVRYTLAVLEGAYNAGLKDFADIHRFKDQLSGQILGIEPGNKGNEMVKEMIHTNAFDLKDFNLVESSEAGMMNSVELSQKLGKWAIFLAWEPHPMNEHFKMKYLSGGDSYFGPNYGAARVATVTRQGFASECPNAALLFKNIRFTVAALNNLMSEEMKGNTNRRRVVRHWMLNNPDVVRQWMDGVTRRDGSSVHSLFDNKISLSRQ